MIQPFESFWTSCASSATLTRTTLYSRAAAVQHWSGQHSDSCEQQQRCSIATSLVKQLTSSPAERLLLRVPVGRVPSCLRLSTVCPLSTSSTVVSSVLSLLFSPPTSLRRLCELSSAGGSRVCW